MTCAGPYTRVFHTKSDSRRARGFVARLEKMGLRPRVTALPTGTQGLEDYSFDLTFEDGAATWTLRMAKFLGTKTFWKQNHVFEVALQRDEGDETWKASLFSDSQNGSFDAFAQAWEALKGGARDLPGLVSYADAHERRIELCHGIEL